MDKTTSHFSSILILIILSALLLFLAGCGGGESSSFSSTISNGISSYSCSSQSAFDSCSGGNCSQCTCTSGCIGPNAPKVKLKISSSKTSLIVGEELQLTLQLSNPANAPQSIGFTLNYPEGETAFIGLPFDNNGCNSLLAQMGASFKSKVSVPAKTNTTCETRINKKFAYSGNPVQISVIDLTSNLELDGPLPTIIVNPQ